MRTRTLMIAALCAVLPGHALYAQPRTDDGASEAPGASAGGDDGDDVSDGPEAKAMLPVKLEELIAVAIQMSPDLSRAKLDRTTANHSAAGEHRSQAWILSTDVEYSKSGVSPDVEAPPYSVVGSEKLQGDLGISRNLPTGGSFSFGVEVSHETQEYNIADTLQPLTTTSGQQQGSPAGSDPSGNPYEFMDVNEAALKVTFKQPLARGFGPRVALANQTKAQLSLTEATVKAQLAAEELVRDIVSGYWELAYASYEVDVRQQSLDLAQAQDDLTHEQMRAGAVPSTALNAVAYEIAQRKEALLRSQLELEKQSLELRRKVGLDLDKRQIVMRPAEQFEIGNDDFDVDEVLARSRVANRQLATIMIEQKIADLDTEVAHDQMKPQVDLTVQGALIGQGTDTSDALSGLGGGDGYQLTVGLSVQFELSSAARRKRDAAAIKHHRLAVDRADAERQIETAVVTAVHEVTAARTRVALEDKAIEVAEDNVRAERANFLVNRTTNFQVMQRQTELIEARLRRGRAVADYHVAVAQLQFLSGLILEQYNVNVRPKQTLHPDASRG